VAPAKPRNYTSSAGATPANRLKSGQTAGATPTVAANAAA